MKKQIKPFAVTFNMARDLERANLFPFTAVVTGDKAMERTGHWHLWAPDAATAAALAEKTAAREWAESPRAVQCLTVLVGHVESAHGWISPRDVGALRYSRAELLTQLDRTTAALELFLPCGARSDPDRMPCNAQGEWDLSGVADDARKAIKQHSGAR